MWSSGKFSGYDGVCTESRCDGAVSLADDVGSIPRFGSPFSSKVIIIIIDRFYIALFSAHSQ